MAQGHRTRKATALRKNLPVGRQGLLVLPSPVDDRNKGKQQAGSEERPDPEGVLPSATGLDFRAPGTLGTADPFQHTVRPAVVIINFSLHGAASLKIRVLLAWNDFSR